MKDALGNDIVIGQLYGYSVSRNGIARTVVDRARMNTGDRVSLTVIKASRFLYGDPIDDTTNHRKTVSINAFMVFPVAEVTA